jgi:hypothetical protein
MPVRLRAASRGTFKELFDIKRRTRLRRRAVRLRLEPDDRERLEERLWPRLG